MRTYLRGLLAVVLALLIGGCGSSVTHAQDSLVVRQNDRVVSRLTMAQLRDLPQVEVATPQSQGAQVQKGPAVRTILVAAGVGGVERVRVEGRDPAQTLTATELTDQIILNITKRNTLKLTGTQLGRDRWVRDVTTLVVNP